jgi:hypothetical protein
VQKTLKERRPLIWVFPEYGGQVAVRFGDFKLVRRGLKTESPGDWELYDLAMDSGEKLNLALDRPEIVRQAKEILRREIAENSIFPLAIPDLNLVEDSDSAPSL